MTDEILDGEEILDDYDPNDPDAAGDPEDTFGLSGTKDDSYTGPKNNEFDEVPPGKYQCVVYEVGFRRSKSSDRPMFNWRFTIVGGDSAMIGRKLFSNNMCDTPEGRRRLLDNVNRVLGAQSVESPRFCNDPERLLDDGFRATLLDNVVEVNVVKPKVPVDPVTGKANSNGVFINKWLRGPQDVAGVTTVADGVEVDLGEEVI